MFSFRTYLTSFDESDNGDLANGIRRDAPLCPPGTSRVSQIQISATTPCFQTQFSYSDLTLILLTWRIGGVPNKASKWQMGFNSAFKGLIIRCTIYSDKTTLKGWHTSCCQPQQILLLCSTHATCFGSTDRPQALKYTTLRTQNAYIYIYIYNL